VRIALAALLLLFVLGAAGAVGAMAQESPGGFQVIVHPRNRIARVSRDTLADIFLKKRTRWPTGSVIRPVDRDPGSTERRYFSSAVMNRPIAAIRSYWRQIIFSGRGVPPPELDSDEKVMAYVRQHEGAVGYVSLRAPLFGVKPLTVTVK
jgi:ABC-type phosphate transport system substrate-binding protein